MRWMIVLCQWIMSQLLKESYENWDTKHSMVVYSGSNTDCKSSEPLKTLVMLCYANLGPIDYAASWAFGKSKEFCVNCTDLRTAPFPRQYVYKRKLPFANSG